ncbi:hypothetical protein vBPpSSYP_50 [Pseudomonas phage vB_PpS_SYP]|nr:hypothetical protein vBPpSSYP_50 [Pseudomonas phage vB_PpS_SYP]
MSIKSEVQSLREQLAQAEAKLRKEQQDNRQSVVQKLNEIKLQMEALEEEATTIAETAGLVFYYARNYDEWSWMNESDWSESSQYC